MNKIFYYIKNNSFSKKIFAILLYNYLNSLKQKTINNIFLIF